MNKGGAASPLVIGLTGGIGSGKTTAANLFAAQGITVVDTDAIAHQLTGPMGGAMDALRAEFGPHIATEQGALDRAAMRRLVFQDSGARARLESVLHPLIRTESHAQCLAAPSPYVLLVVPLLFESGQYRQRVARVAVVDCPEEQQIARVMARSQLSSDDVQRIMAAQIPRQQRLAQADDVIHNTGSLADLQAQVLPLHQHYLSLAQQH